MKNEKVTEATSVQWDRRAMTIKYIAEVDVKFASMVIGYKIYHSSRDNFVSGMTIYAAYEMVKQNAKYDLCELLRSQLMENLRKVKKAKKNTFKCGNLLLCLCFYFMDEVPGVGKVHWKNDEAVAVQIRNMFFGIGDRQVRNTTLWGYFKNF